MNEVVNINYAQDHPTLRRDMAVEQHRRVIESGIRADLYRLKDVRIAGHSVSGEEVVETMHDIDPDRYMLAIALAGSTHEHWAPEMLAALKSRAVDHVINDFSGLIWRQAAKEADGE